MARVMGGSVEEGRVVKRCSRVLHSFVISEKIFFPLRVSSISSKVMVAVTLLTDPMIIYAFDTSARVH